MKITLLPYQLGGTGGAIAAIRIGNTFVRHGHDVAAYTEQMPEERMVSFMKFPCISIKEMPKHSPDAVLCFNPGRKSQILDAFLTLPGRKFWRLGLVALHDYDEVAKMDDIIKICTTTNDKRLLDANGVKNGHIILGPANPEDFYPYSEWPDFRNRNVVMSYLKKSGWVAVTAINMVQKKRPEIIFASLGSEIPGKDHCVVSETPIIKLGAPAHLRDFIRYSYCKAGVFVDTNSNGYWAWSSTVAEAMLCECPVVSTNSPEFDDIVIDRVTALTAPCDEETELPVSSVSWQDWRTRPKAYKIADLIMELLDDEKLRGELVTNARELVLRYDLNYWYTEFMKLME